MISATIAESNPTLKIMPFQIDPFGPLGIGVTLAIAAWQFIEARIAKKETRKATEELQRMNQEAHKRLLELPGALIRGIGEVVRRAPDVYGSTGEWATPGSLDGNSSWIQSRYADINNDGTDELLIEVISGPHSTALLVFKCEPWEFKQIAELYCTTGHGFDVTISDEGKNQVETVEVSKRADLPYVMGFRDRVTYMLKDNQFVETGRVEGWDDADLRLVREEENKLF